MDFKQIKAILNSEADFSPATAGSETERSTLQPPDTDDSNSVPLQAEQLQALMNVLDRIRRPLALDLIFDTTAHELRHLLKADRVGVFRFYPERDWEGEFVAESVGEAWTSAIKVKVYDHCFGEQFAPAYAEGRVQAIADIHEAGLSQCHADILAKFQVRANLAVPVLMGKHLWGLLCIHQCDAPRVWQNAEIEFVKQLAEHFSVAVQQAEFIQTVQRQATQLEQSVKREKALAKTVEKIRQSLDIDTIFQATTQEIRQLLNVDRVAIYRFNPDWSGEFVAESFSEGWTPLVGVQGVIADTHLAETNGGRYVHNETSAVTDIYQAGLKDCHIQLLEQFQAKAYAIAPIWQNNRLWGLIAAYQNSTPHHWQDHEVDLITHIGVQMGVALQHHETLLQSQLQTERQKTLTRVIARIRESLDFNIIFKTTVREVRQLLEADRVGVFRLYPEADWEGEFVAEDVGEGWTSALQVKVHDYCFSENFVSLYQQGRVHAIADIYQTDFKECYVEILKQFQVRSNVVAPLLQGDQLWGLLCIHQCESARHWKPSEIEFVSQIAEQLGVALKQDVYLKQCQNQATQLAEAAERDKAMIRQRLLAATVDKIRRSLDIDTIFKTTTEAVRELLDVERVGIYQFDETLSGRFVADSIMHGWARTVSPTVTDDAFLQPDEHGNYPRYETFVPISAGESEKLWGLLVASQNSQPRYWQPEEIALLAQVGGQLGVAIQQAELLKHTKKQTEELTQALRDLQYTQTQLIQGEKMASLGQLVAGVAHEINNPVNFIYGNAPLAIEQVEELVNLIRLYQAKFADPGEEILVEAKAVDIDFVVSDLPKLLISMQMGAQRIRDIVQSLRNFSRMDEAEVKAVDIHEGLDSTLLILKHRIQPSNNGLESSIEVVKEYGDLPRVDCYAGQLNQVFMNLLSNAIDALEEKVEQDPQFKPQIRLRTEFVKDWITIQIADNGAGIAEEIRSRLFDPFFTTKPIGKGTGLGLSISYQIVVEKHQGHLKCNSTPGKGTTFAIHIPLRQSTT